MAWWVYLIAAVLLFIWVLAGFYITQATIQMRPYRHSDPAMDRAHTLAFWAGFSTWMLVGIFSILIVLGLVFGMEFLAAADAEGGGVTSILGIIFLFISMFVLGLVGVLSAMAAVNLRNSPSYKSSNPKLAEAHRDCVIAAVLALSAIGLVFVLFIILIVMKVRSKKKVKTDKEKKEKLVSSILESKSSSSRSSPYSSRSSSTLRSSSPSSSTPRSSLSRSPYSSSPSEYEMQTFKRY